MDAFINGLIGGLAPTVVLVIIYFFTLAGRMAKIETDICWIIRELKGCRLRSNDRTV